MLRGCQRRSWIGNFWQSDKKGNITMKTIRRTSQGARKPEVAQHMRSGVLTSEILARPVGHCPLRVGLSVVNRLLPAVEHRAITCWWPVETPPISTDL